MSTEGQGALVRIANIHELASIPATLTVAIDPISLQPIVQGIGDSETAILDKIDSIVFPPPVSLTQVNAKLDALIAALVPTPPPVNALPTIGLTSSVLVATEPGSILLSATPADSDGAITKVEYYDNNVFIGQRVQVPFTFTYTNVLAGQHSLTAKAFDNATPAGTATSAASLQTIDPVVVVPPPPPQQITPIPIIP